ncbi:MAG: phytanoyl-CoA dioxygenase family protein [Kofleriaceae bacterium]|nr:phytanoyl-CoA dioxygenase family protein [Kofleriaceae bacterium]MCB9572503.1 phytanoyl-CoA dioxygenase family protein [Kofleriaceae bacterium]
MISVEQRARFEADGFLRLPGFVAPAACDALRTRAAALVDAVDADELGSVFSTRDQVRTTDDYFLDSGDQVRCFLEEDAVDDAGRLRRDKALAINKIGHALHDLDPVFDGFSRTAELAALVAALGVDDPRLMQSMYIFKQPFIGGEVRIHQDATFLHTEPPGVIGLWFALQDATVDNGCLWAIPGGHAGGLRSRFVRDGRRTRMEVLDPTPWDEAELIPLEARQGDLIVLHGLAPHASRPNRSPTSRHAYTLHVVPGGAAYPASNWLQRATPARGFR